MSSSGQEADKAPRKWGRPSWVTRGMTGIVLATFFSDVGHEMVTAVLALYLTSIGLGPAALGVMEGAADFAFSLSKLAGGMVGHRVKRKRLARGAWLRRHGDVHGGDRARLVRICDRSSSSRRVGRARIPRPAPRFSSRRRVDASHFGRAYGVERAADMLGAVAGPLLALLMLALGAPIVAVIAVSFAPSLLSALFILTLTRDRALVESDPSAVEVRGSRRLPRRFWLLVVGVLLFGLGDFSRTFLIFLVANSLGGSAAHGALTGGVLAYTAHNVVSGVAAFPVGRLGDRIPKWKVLVGGYALGVATNLVLAGAASTLWGLTVAVVGSGIYVAVEETVEKAAMAELLPREQRSLGFGILASANAIGDMASSLYVGTLLAAGRGSTAFAIAGALGAIGTIWVFVVGRSRQRATA